MKLKQFSIKQKQYLDKINELLSIRQAKEDSIIHTNKLIKEGLSLIETMPIRWYVRNRGQKEFDEVLNYLNKKYKRKLEGDRDCGYGELHGELTCVPDDVNYSWEITQEEFDFLNKKIKAK